MSHQTIIRKPLLNMKILATLGPSSLSEDVISELSAAGVDMFRINLSHTRTEDLQDLVERIRNTTTVPICFDSEGAQIRTGRFEDGDARVSAGDICLILRKEVLGSPRSFNLYPPEVFDYLNIGSMVYLDFNTVIGVITEVNEDTCSLKILYGGTIGSNKAVVVNPVIKLPPFTEKDLRAFETGKRLGIKNVALSFAHCGNDINLLRRLCLDQTFVISKIECKEGINNLDEIVSQSDAILIDRGDLSREVPLEQVPMLQKHIIGKCVELGKPAYVATNFLETMVSSRLPTRAEINDIYTTLLDGASGIVLAAETAIGKFPVQSVNIVKTVITALETTDRTTPLLNELPIIDNLPAPHGGDLVQCFIEFNEDIDKLPKVHLPDEVLLDIEQICHGVYSPLRGFMGEEELSSVLRTNRLLTGETWTLPITLLINDEDAAVIREADSVVVTRGGTPHSLIQIKSVKSINLEDHVKLWFNTDDVAHPGVAKILKHGRNLVQCDVFLFSRQQYTNKHVSYPPVILRKLFREFGWSKVVGFHTRNVPHGAHEFIQSEALKIARADGMLVGPVLGPKKAGDFNDDIVVSCYDILNRERNRTSTKFLLSAFNYSPRYAGPREAVFTAIVRKNMGCSHFVVGRDHAGVQSFYTKSASVDYFSVVGDLGIDIIKFGEVGYDRVTNSFDFNIPVERRFLLSGTDLRNRLTRGEEIPTWYLRRDFQNLLRERPFNGEQS